MKWSALEDEPCSLARTVAVIGDRWTLLILRECFLRVRRFEAFQANLGITRHVLAARLKKLVRFGLNNLKYRTKRIGRDGKLGEHLAKAQSKRLQHALLPAQTLRRTAGRQIQAFAMYAIVREHTRRNDAAGKRRSDRKQIFVRLENQ